MCSDLRLLSPGRIRTDDLPLTRRMLGVGLDGSRPIRRIVWMIIGMINAHPTKSDAKASGSCSTTESISGVRLRCVSLAVGLLGCSPRRPGPTSGQGLTGGDLAGHLGQLPSRGPGSPAQNFTTSLVAPGRRRTSSSPDSLSIVATSTFDACTSSPAQLRICAMSAPP